MSNRQIQIAAVCDEIKELLLQKNEKYGDSALNPARIFSKSSTVEQLLVRIDDKLNRIKQGKDLLSEDEDVVKDLIGYLVLLTIARKQQDSLTSSSKPGRWSPDKICIGDGVNSYWPNDPWDGADLDNVYDFDGFRFNLS